MQELQLTTLLLTTVVTFVQNKTKRSNLAASTKQRTTKNYSQCSLKHTAIPKTAFVKQTPFDIPSKTRVQNPHLLWTTTRSPNTHHMLATLELNPHVPSGVSASMQKGSPRTTTSCKTMAKEYTSPGCVPFFLKLMCRKSSGAVHSKSGKTPFVFETRSSRCSNSLQLRVSWAWSTGNIQRNFLKSKRMNLIRNLKCNNLESNLKGQFSYMSTSNASARKCHCWNAWRVTFNVRSTHFLERQTRTRANLQISKRTERFEQTTCSRSTRWQLWFASEKSRLKKRRICDGQKGASCVEIYNSFNFHLKRYGQVVYNLAEYGLSIHQQSWNEITKQHKSVMQSNRT